MPKMTVTTVYDLDMPKYIYVQLHPAGQGSPIPPVLKIRADKIEKKDGGGMVLKIGTEQIGEFAIAPLAWRIQDEG